MPVQNARKRLNKMRRQQLGLASQEVNDATDSMETSRSFRSGSNAELSETGKETPLSFA